jgi:hypothetical protein
MLQQLNLVEIETTSNCQTNLTSGQHTEKDKF